MNDLLQMQVEQAVFTNSGWYAMWEEAFYWGIWPDGSAVDLAEAQANAIAFGSLKDE